jgi:hypothetical protein
MNPYTDSPYAHERVGFDLHCEASPGFPLTEGSVPKCIHCREEFEHHAEHPQPCIERIAMALEEARGAGSRLLFSQRAALDRAGVPTSGPDGAPVSDGWRVVWLAEEFMRLRGLIARGNQSGKHPGPAREGVYWLPDGNGNAIGYHPSLSSVVGPGTSDALAVEFILGPPVVPEHLTAALARWPKAWSEVVSEPGNDRWAILGTGLDVAPTGDTLAEAWAAAARRAGEASR